MTNPTFRIDAFTVPAAARDTFLSRIRATHRVLRDQTGFRGDRIVERETAPGESRIVTIVEWADEAAIPAAVEAVKAAHAADGFSPADFVRDNGIAADLGFYRPVA
jgi:Uncharacterized enzyme involved in biosynthesis of extracellular polysaccharides